MVRHSFESSLVSNSHRFSSFVFVVDFLLFCVCVLEWVFFLLQLVKHGVKLDIKIGTFSDINSCLRSFLQEQYKFCHEIVLDFLSSPGKSSVLS